MAGATTAGRAHAPSASSRHFLKLSATPGQVALALGIAVFLVLFLVIPVGTVIYVAFTEKGTGEFTLVNFLDFARTDLFIRSFWNSVYVSAMSVVLASVFALPLAYITTRFEFRGAMLIQTLGFLPLIMPPFVGAVAMLLLFGAIYFLRPLLPWLRTIASPESWFLWTSLALIPVGLVIGAAHLSFHGSPGEKVRKGLGIALVLAGALGAWTWKLTPKLHLPWITDEKVAFARAHGVYARASNQDMLTAALEGLVARHGLAGEQVGEVAAGAVLKHSRDFNLTRESVLGSSLAPTTPAYDVQQACGTGLEAAVLVANKIALGQVESGIAGGTDTASDAPDGPDNITVSPYGGLFLAEDGEGVQHLFGITPDGESYPFARNALNESEFTGVNFSPAAGTMFANIQDPGITLAITGPFSGLCRRH